MKKNYRKSVLIGLAIILCTLCSVSFSFGTDVKVVTPEIVTAPSNSLVPNPTPRFKLNISKVLPNTKSIKGTSLPVKYDLRQLSLVTSVKNQSIYGTCWAFAACSCAESSMIKQGYDNINADYSEAHLVNTFYDRVNDPLGNTDGDGQTILDNDTPAVMFGGDDNKTLIALSGWTGIADEATMPYANITKGLNPNLAYKDTAIIKNGYIISNDVNTIKQALVDYGALNVAYYADKKYYGSDNTSYYCNTFKYANHEVSLVGWDDTYSKNNFASSAKPSSDGAWIIKNSWGKNEGDNGYIYISYEDKSLTDIIAYQFQPASTYDHNYYYDGNSFPEFLESPYSTIKTANVYTAKGNSPSGEELIKAVGLVSYAPGATYKVQIYKNPTSSTNPESGTPMFSTRPTGSIKGAGFTTIELKNAVRVKEGEKFSVVIELSNLTYVNGYYPSVGTETSYNDGYVFYNASIASKQSFVSIGGGWEDLANRNWCARIKVFTTDASLSAPTSLVCSLYGYDDVKASWSKVAGASGYKVYYKKSTASDYTYKGYTSGTSMKIANLADGAKYYVKVVPYKTINGVPYKGNYRISSPIYTLKKLSTPSVYRYSSSKVTVKWTNISGESGYQISRSTSKTKTGTLYTVKTTTGKSKVISATKGKTYYYKVRAYRTGSSGTVYGPWSYVRAYKLK